MGVGVTQVINKNNKTVNLKESEIRGLCKQSRSVFMSQPVLLELESPIRIVGKTQKNL